MIGPDEVTIETPEQIELGLEPVGPVTRYLAWLVDGLIKGVVLLILGALLMVFGGVFVKEKEPIPGQPVAQKQSANPIENSIVKGLAGYLIAAGIVIVVLVTMGYDVYFEVRNNGQTPGKWVAGSRVVLISGAPVNFIAACVRLALCPVDHLPVLYFLGGTVMMMNSHRQRLGDLAAGTLVIRERYELPFAELAKEVKELANEQITFTNEQLNNCLVTDRHILRAYFQRYKTMTSDARRDLARRLVDTLIPRLKYVAGPPVKTGKESVQFLAALYTQLEHWYQNR